MLYELWRVLEPKVLTDFVVATWHAFSSPEYTRAHTHTHIYKGNKTPISNRQAVWRWNKEGDEEGEEVAAPMRTFYLCIAIGIRIHHCTVYMRIEIKCQKPRQKAESTMRQRAKKQHLNLHASQSSRRLTSFHNLFGCLVGFRHSSIHSINRTVDSMLCTNARDHIIHRFWAAKTQQ